MQKTQNGLRGWLGEKNGNNGWSLSASHTCKPALLSGWIPIKTSDTYYDFHEGLY